MLVTIAALKPVQEEGWRCEKEEATIEKESG
jgi:hypothetical protein